MVHLAKQIELFAKIYRMRGQGGEAEIIFILEKFRDTVHILLLISLRCFLQIASGCCRYRRFQAGNTGLPIAKGYLAADDFRCYCCLPTGGTHAHTQSSTLDLS